MGYHWVSDEVLEAARRGSDSTLLEVQNLSDPSKGELFQIIEALQRDGC